MNKFTHSFLTAQAFVVAVLATRLHTARRNERGVVSIEYIVLGAAIIALIGILATNTAVSDALGDAFQGLFEDAGGNGGIF